MNPLPMHSLAVLSQLENHTVLLVHIARAIEFVERPGGRSSKRYPKVLGDLVGPLSR